MTVITPIYDLPLNDYIKRGEKEVMWDDKKITVVVYQPITNLKMQERILKIVMLMAKIVSFNQIMRVESFKNQWKKLSPDSFLVDKSLILEDILKLDFVSKDVIAIVKSAWSKTQSSLQDLKLREILSQLKNK